MFTQQTIEYLSRKNYLLKGLNCEHSTMLEHCEHIYENGDFTLEEAVFFCQILNDYENETDLAENLFDVNSLDDKNYLYLQDLCDKKEIKITDIVYVWIGCSSRTIENIYCYNDKGFLYDCLKSKE